MAKIICTLGPSSKTFPRLRDMTRAGMDVARLNFSHGTYARHLHCIHLIRKLNSQYRSGLKILQDLEGYRIRIGRFRGTKEVELRKGRLLLLTNKRVLGDRTLIPLDCRGPLGGIRIGSFVYIDDGNIALRVRSRAVDSLKAEVIVPGVLKEHKGVNIPDLRFEFKGLTEKDKKDLRFGIRNKVDFIAQSFVRSKGDILVIREFLKAHHFNCKIIAKIENRQGIQNIDEILDASDGIMVARGDMGVSLPIYEVPVIQKTIIKKCNRKKKFVITATQMLESMTEHIRPTRAEVSDVANAILDGSNYVMLSAETAVGKHPVETVEMMRQIIRFTERSRKKHELL